MPRDRQIPFRTRALYNSKEEWEALHKEYMDANDPTEYLFATNSKILDGGKPKNKWLHWQAILLSPYCESDIKQWKEELEMKLRAIAIQKIVQASDENLAAQRYLASGEWKKDTRTAGRPTNAEVQSERKKAAKRLDLVEKLASNAGV